MALMNENKKLTTMKRIVFYALLLLPTWVWGQRELVIEGPNDKVAPVVLQVKSDFDQDKGILKLTITGDDTAESNALWLMEAPTPYNGLEKYFKGQQGKLKFSSFFKEQMKFMNLSGKTAQEVVHVVGAEVADRNILIKEGVKAAIQKQVLPLDNRSTLVLNLKVQAGVELVTLELHNPLLLFHNSGKYELAFVGQDVTMDFDVAADNCGPKACLLEQLRGYNAVFAKAEAALTGMQEGGGNGLDKAKALVVSEFEPINLKRFENTKCKDIDDELAELKDLMARVKAMGNPSGGGAGGGGGASGQGGATGADDCNLKKVNEDLKGAVVKLNTYANDWMSATDATVKQAKKVAFDALVKETDAKLNAVTPACRKKLNGTTLKNYEMAKKLIK